jgi:hypothetical protein
MGKVSLAEHMQEVSQAPGRGGPFVTISRQYGCFGFALGMLLQDILNEDAAASPASRGGLAGGHVWRIYNREILDRLARQTKLPADLLDAIGRGRPSMVRDLLHALANEHVPSGLVIRDRINTIIRGMACQGHAIIIGQGGSAVAQDVPNGLSVRLEAPLEWRVSQIAIRRGMSMDAAARDIEQKESEREYLRQIYLSRHPRTPIYQLVYDCSAFTLAQIAQHVVGMMRLKRMA